MTRDEAIAKLKIYRDYLCKMSSMFDANEVAKPFNMAIESLSIKVVRCKDCKHYTERQYMGKSLFVCNVFEWHSQPNDYCSFGERRK